MQGETLAQGVVSSGNGRGTGGQADRVAGRGFWPPPPRTIADTGLLAPFIEDHLLRVLYFELQMTGAELAGACGVPFGTLQPLIHGLTRDHLFEVVGQAAPTESGYRYMLAPKGRERAEEALKRTLYHGSLPVPLEYYLAGVRAQSIGEMSFRREDLRQAFSGLVISAQQIDRLGPAVNTNTSIFLHGSPGNGKTVVAERIAKMIGGAIFVPHAIEVDGSIILLYDFLNHFPVDEPDVPRHDARWVRVKRPAIIASSELTLAALDLIWNPSGRFYEAPPQVKANGGTFLIDDFGRQQVRPIELLNRWIIPLERRIDYLTLETGKKFEVPFDVLLLLSTNLDPRSLSDEAFQRRVPFRVHMKDPDEAQFAEVFEQVCVQRGVPFDPATFEWLFDTWWRKPGRPMRFVHPRNIMTQVIATARYLERQPAMDRDLLDLACSSYFEIESLESGTSARFS